MSQALSSQFTQPPDIFFVGRKREQRDYEKLLVGESPWMMVITGMAGTGKSTLLRHLAEKTTSRNIPVLILDFAQPWAQIDILAILEKLAEQVSRYCNLRKYQEFKETLKKDREKLANAAKSKQVMVEAMAATHGGQIIGGEQQVIQSDDPYKKACLREWEDARSAFHDLIDTFNYQRLVIMLDTSEWLSEPGNSDKQETGRWIMNDFAPQLHDHMRGKQQYCSFVIASQDHPQLPAIYSYRQAIVDHGPMDMLEWEEADQYLQHENIGDDQLRRQIYDITRGHPFFVSLICDRLKQGEQESIINKLPQIQPERNTKEWLQYFAESMMGTGLPWHFSDLARYSALLRTFDRTTLQEVFSDLFPTEKEAKEQIDQLMSASYIIRRGDRYAFHDLLREILATYVRVHEQEKWQWYHERALGSLAKKSAARSPYPLDWYYHALAHDKYSDEKLGLALWRRAVDQAYTEGSISFVSALLLVAQDRTLELSSRACAVLAFEQGRYNYSREHWEDALNDYKQSLDYYQRVGDSPGRAEVYTKMADVQRYRKDSKSSLADALSYYDQAYHIYLQMKDPLHQAYMLQGMGDVQRLLGKLDEALKKYDKASTLYEAEKESNNVAYVRKSMGDTLALQCSMLAQRSESARDAALKYYDEAEALFPPDDFSGLANLYKARGDLQADHNPAAAIRDYTLAISIYQKMSNGGRRSQASMYIAIGDVEKSRKNWEAARWNYERAFQLYREIDDIVGQASMRQSIGEMNQKLKRWDDALNNYTQGIKDSLGIGDYKKVAFLYQKTGETWRERNDKDTEPILQNYGKALEYYQKVGDNAGIAYVSQIMGELQQFLGHSDEALKDYEQALAHYEHAKDNKEKDNAGIAYIYKVMGDVEQSRGHSNEALKDYEQALAHYERAKDNKEKDKAGIAYVSQIMGELQQFLGHSDEALKDYEQALAYYEHAKDNKEKDNAGIAYIYKVMGELQQFLGHSNEALKDYERAKDNKEKDNAGIAYVSQIMGELQQFLGHSDEALKDYEQALAHYERAKDNKEKDNAGIAYIYKVMGDVEQSRGHSNEALKDYKQALAHYERAKDNKEKDNAGIAYIYKVMGDVEQSRGHLDIAMDYLKESRELCLQENWLQMLAVVYMAIGDIQQSRPDLGVSLESYNCALFLYNWMHDQESAAKVHQAISKLQPASTRGER